MQPTRKRYLIWPLKRFGGMQLPQSPHQIIDLKRHGITLAEVYDCTWAKAAYSSKTNWGNADATWYDFEWSSWRNKFSTIQGTPYRWFRPITREHISLYTFWDLDGHPNPIIRTACLHKSSRTGHGRWGFHVLHPSACHEGYLAVDSVCLDWRLYK